VERLYREVRDEVQEMYQYVLVRRTQRLQWRLNQIGLLVGWPVLVLTFLIAIGPTFDWRVVGVVLMVSLVLGILILLRISRQAGGGEG